MSAFAEASHSTWRTLIAFGLLGIFNNISKGGRRPDWQTMASTAGGSLAHTWPPLPLPRLCDHAGRRQQHLRRSCGPRVPGCRGPRHSRQGLGPLLVPCSGVPAPHGGRSRPHVWLLLPGGPQLFPSIPAPGRGAGILPGLRTRDRVARGVPGWASPRHGGFGGGMAGTPRPISAC